MFSLYFIEMSHTQICSPETLSVAYFLLIDTNRNKTSEMSGGSALLRSVLTNKQNQVINKKLRMDDRRTNQGISFNPFYILYYIILQNKQNVYSYFRVFRAMINHSEKDLLFGNYLRK